ncbi:MAG: DUF433 domain-containing protein [Chloroflexota bacterium]
MDTPLIYKGQDVMSGTPVFYGTRVPVQTLIDYITTGDTIEIFLEDFPTVSREQVVRFLEDAGHVMMAYANEN